MAGERVARLALVQSRLGAAAQVQVAQPVQHEHRAFEPSHLAQRNSQAVLPRVSGQPLQHGRRGHRAGADGRGHAQELVPVLSDVRHVDRMARIPTVARCHVASVRVPNESLDDRLRHLPVAEHACERMTETVECLVVSIRHVAVREPGPVAAPVLGAAVAISIPAPGRAVGIRRRGVGPRKPENRDA